MSEKRLWLAGALLTLFGAVGCGPWCERWCEKHHPVPAVAAAPCCQPCAPAPPCCAPGAVAAPNWQRTVPNGCYP